MLSSLISDIIAGDGINGSILLQFFNRAVKFIGQIRIAFGNTDGILFRIKRIG